MSIREFLDALRSTQGQHTLASVLVCTCSISSSSEAECFNKYNPISLNLRCILKSNKRFTY